MAATHLRNRLLALIAGVLLGQSILPDSAAAHGISGRASLPVPAWLFAWAAAIVLVVSFAALYALWTSPRLQQQHLKALFRLPSWLRPICGSIGVGLFGLVVYAGYAGARSYARNFDPTFIYVVFWVGVPIASVLIGDVFGAFSPWRAVTDGARWVLLRAGRDWCPPLRYPAWLGRWPVVVGLLAFGWLELVYHDRDNPVLLASLSIAYVLVMVVGTALFGAENWTRRGDAFGAYFNLVSRLAPLEVRGRVVWLRRPLSGVTSMEIMPGTIAVVLTIIGVTTFDGASNGVIWKTIGPHIQSVFSSLGVSDAAADELADTVGLMVALAVVSCFFYLGVAGMRTVSRRFALSSLSTSFVHTLVPIAFAYVVAHYFSLLVWQGQALAYLASNPLGGGANLLGTAHWHINYSFISSTGIWYVEVAALLLGHVSGLILAHDRAIAMYRTAIDAARSQYWMLMVMVTFTCMGLWLLSAVNA